MIIPNSDIYLLKTEIDMDNQNQLLFDNLQAQLNYFSSLDNQYMPQATYQRKDNQLYFDGSFDVLVKYNYCMYRNTEYSNKWFFAYVTDVRYVNDNTCAIDLKTDVFQTWMFDLEYKKSFVEREHVNDDGIGHNTVPEGLETGDFISNGVEYLYSGGNSVYIAITSTWYPDELSFNTNTVAYNGVYSGTPILIFNNGVTEDDNGYLSASNFLRAMDLLGKGDAITGIYLIPTELINNPTFTLYGVSAGGRTINFKAYKLAYSDDYKVLNDSGNISAPTSIAGYSPRNKKLLTSPYSYFYVSNNVGADVDFKWEDFIENKARFVTMGSITPGCSIRCVPVNYKKESDTGSNYYSYNYGITGAKYPICSWQTDLYTNWLTQNSVNLTTSLVGAGVSMAGGLIGIASGAGALVGAGAIVGGITTVINSVKSIAEHSYTPPQSNGNANAGDITFSAHKMNLPMHKMCIRNEYAKIIDGFFDMYGYKVNSLKVPNLRGRRNWNYVKTIGANIHGYIPQKDMKEIKNMFDAGITLWHNPNTFLDYSQNNDII